MNSGLNNLVKKAFGGHLVKAVLGMAALAAIPTAAMAHERSRVRVDFDLGPSRPVVEEHVGQVWVEPVYQTVCDHVWVPAVTQMVCDHVLVPDRYEVRAVERFIHGRRVIVRENVLAEPAHYVDQPRDVVVTPGHYEDVQRQVLVAPGHWESRVEEHVVTERPAAVIGFRFPVRW